MIISAIGDSLTEGDYGIKGKTCIPNVKSENYPYFLSEILGCEVKNYGKSGYTATSYLQFYKDGNVDVKNSDIIIVMLGTNGGFSPDEETQGNKDMRSLLELISADAPNAKVILCTPPHCTENPEYSNCGYMPRVKAAVGFIRKLAAEKNLTLFDIFARPEFTAETESIMQPNDGLHFGTTGYKTLAGIMAEELKANKFIK